jgi:ribosomal protein L2
MITGVKEKKRKHQLLLAREAFGMWANRKDINDNWVKAGRSRWVSAWRDG